MTFVEGYKSKTSFRTYDFAMLRISWPSSAMLLEWLPVEFDQRNIGTLQFIESSFMSPLLVFATAIVLAQLKRQSSRSEVIF